MKKSTIILAILLLFSNVGWVLFSVYSLIDCGVTQTYQDASVESTQKMLDQAIIVANLGLVGKSLAEAKQLLPKDTDDSEPFEKERCLYVGGLCLVINSKQIIAAIAIE